MGFLSNGYFIPTARGSTKNDPRTTAFHEAAHAVIGVRVGIKIKYVTNICKNGITYGHIHWWRRDAKIRKAYKDMALLAGVWGEVLAERGERPWPIGVGVYIADVPAGPRPYKHYGHAKHLVWKYRREITRVAETLMVRRRMTGYEVAVVAFGQGRCRT